MVAKIGGKVPTIGEKEQWLKLSIKDGQIKYEVEGLSPFDIITLAT